VSDSVSAAGIRLDGTVALVTGGARGLGLAMASGLAEVGARVMLVDRDQAALEQAVAGISESAGAGNVRAHLCDINLAASCEKAVAAAVAEFGTLGVLINNAGRGPTIVEQSPRTRSMAFWEADPERWAEVIATNVIGTFHMSRAAAPTMIAAGWGRIVNITTSLVTMKRKGGSPYGVSKVAIEAETLIWADDLAGTGVTVNSLIPGGAADTDFVSAKTRAAARAGQAELLSPLVMVAPIRWLASPLSDGVTGARFVGKLWDASLPPAAAAEKAREAPVVR
jgi:NAD(P)-dependent dehydrogenase (short-subunit alcohol dehydrogenase family)